MIVRRLKADYNTRLKIILKFCKSPAKIDWEQEMRIASLLIEEYGKEVFIKLSYEFLSFEMESLAQFQSKKFRAFLEKQKRLFKLDFTKERAIIGKQKIGKDKTIKRKPKTLLNFLNYDSKKENKTTG